MRQELDSEGIGADLDEVLADYMRRVDRGERVDYEAIIAAHPALATELREYFSHAVEVERLAAGVTADMAQQATPRGALEIRCPSCHAPMVVAVDTALTDLTCSACGSHFSLVNQNKATWMAPSLTKMGRFELVERIGVGGFGSVWKARDKDLDRTVAIKIPRQGCMTSEEQEKFFREARAAAQLRHPNIVSVHEVGRDGDSVYIVSDFVRGVTLGDWLTGQQLTNREAAELCATIADALHHAHENGVVHRDLKPANIMIDAEGKPHLMDFGLARREVGEVTVTMEGQILGTPAYMSPEQAQGEGHTADRRSDVYSLGVILFQLLTGELPFRGNARMLIHQMINEPAPSPRRFNGSIRKDIETVTLKCLDKAPERRYQTADELAKDLRRFLRGEPVHAKPASKLERAWRWCQRRPAVAGLIAAGAAAIVAFAAWGLREVQNAREWRLQLSDNLVQSAELLGRTGNWKAALDQLDQARSLGSRDRIALQLQRVKALTALASPESVDEINHLAMRTDLGQHEAAVRLLQGLDLLVTDGLPSATPLLKQAKEIGTLSASDEALVDGLLAPTSPEALDHFRRAVELAPFGQEARRFYVLMLSSLGRFDEATKQAEVGQAFFPEDPNFPLLLAYVEAGAGHTEKISQRLQAKSLSQVDSLIVQNYGKALRNLAALHEESAGLWDFALTAGMQRYGWDDPQQQEYLFSEVFQGVLVEQSETLVLDTKPEELIKQFELVRALSSPSERRSTGPLPVSELARRAMTRVPNCLVLAYEPIRDMFSLRTMGFLNEAKGNVDRIDYLIDRLEASGRAHPDSFISYARGLLLFMRGRLAEAAPTFSTSAEQFSSFGGFAEQASFAAAVCEFILYRRGDDSALDRAVGHMQSRLDRGPLTPRHAAALFEIAMESKDFDSARRLLAAGDANQRPTPKVIVARAKVELAAENYLEALRIVEDVPSSAAEYSDAVKIQNQCLENVAKVVNDHQPASASQK